METAETQDQRRDTDFNTVPDEILVHILAWVDMATLRQALLVSRRFARIGRDPYFPPIVSFRVEVPTARWPSVTINGTRLTLLVWQCVGSSGPTTYWNMSLNAEVQKGPQFKVPHIIDLRCTDDGELHYIIRDDRVLVRNTESASIAMFVTYCRQLMTVPLEEGTDWTQKTRELLETVTGDPHILRRLLRAV